MREMERILLECRYLLSLNKNFSDLAIIFHVSEDIILDDLTYKLPKIDTILYNRVMNVLKINNCL